MKHAQARFVAAALIAATILAGCGSSASSSWSFPAGSPVAATVPSAAATTPASPSPTIEASPTPFPSPSALPAASPNGSPAPLPSGFVRLADRRVPPATIPVLYYHRVQPLPADYASLSKAKRAQFTTYDTLPQAFAAQLDWLRDHGYTTILPRDLADHWDKRTNLPARPVIITFDDGSRDWVKRVLPMLKERGMVAEFYLTLDAIKHGNLTWPEVRRLAAAGNGIGAHDVHHVQLAALGPGRKPASKDVMWAEINDARTIIGQHVGVYPDSMAYVGGGYDETLQRLVEQAGYTSARGIARGIIQTPGRRFAMRVVRVGVHDDVTSLAHETLVPGLPTFTARMAGVPDK